MAQNQRLELRVDSPKLTGEFQSLSPTAPLPWKFGARPYEVVDANERLVASVHGVTFADSIRTAGMIIVAANTCGGIKMTDN